MAASRCFQRVLELEPDSSQAQQEVRITGVELHQFTPDYPWTQKSRSYWPSLSLILLCMLKKYYWASINPLSTFTFSWKIPNPSLSMREWRRSDLRRETSEWSVVKWLESSLFADKRQRVTVGDLQVVFCMDRALEYAPSCHKFKILKAECLALLGRYPEAQSVARYHNITDEGIRSDSREDVAHATCLCVVIFCEWTPLMQMPCMFVVCVCIMRTALTRPSSSLSKPCAWLLTTKRLDWHAEWVYFYARLTLTVVFRPKCWNQRLQLLFVVFWVTFVNLLDRITLRMVIFAECQGTESQEGGGEQGVQRGKLWGGVWPVLWGTHNRPKQHQDKRQTLL